MVITLLSVRIISLAILANCFNLFHDYLDTMNENLTVSQFSDNRNLFGEVKFIFIKSSKIVH